MTTPPGAYGNPQNPNNPFQQPLQQPYPQARREYDTESDMGDHYGNPNSSTTRLAGSQAYYEQTSESIAHPIRVPTQPARLTACWQYRWAKKPRHSTCECPSSFFFGVFSVFMP